MKKIVEDSKRFSTVGVDAKACKCTLRKKHELPRTHELAEYSRVNMHIPIDCIDSHWRKLDMTPSMSIQSEVVVHLSNCWAEELDLISQQFSHANDLEKIILLKRLQELVNELLIT